MVRETWTTVELPILETVLSGEDDPQRATGELIDRCGREARFQRSLAALIEDGYVGGAGVHWALGRSDPIITADIVRLTPKGRRAVGQWPSGQPGDVLIRTLESALVDLPDGETKIRLRGLLAAAREVGTEVLSGVVSNVLKATLGLP